MAEQKVHLKLSFEGAEDEQRLPEEVVAYAVSASGKIWGEAQVELGEGEGKATLALPEELEGKSLRLMVGPRLKNDDAEAPTVHRLRRYQAVEREFVVGRDPQIDLAIVNSQWLYWIWCLCPVVGKVVKRVTDADGSVRELPVCNARVCVYEVDRWPWILRRLPDTLISRLRDDLLKELHVRPRPIPLPLPDPPPLRRPLGRLHTHRLSTATANLGRLGVEEASVAETDSNLEALALLDPVARPRVLALANSLTLADARHQLSQLPVKVFLPYLCLWPWLHPFFFHTKQSLMTLDVDAGGNFSGIFFYPCHGDKPDLYFEVKQNQGGVWKTVYKPSVACNTHWNYPCGTEVTLVVTDPSVETCDPDPPVVPPPGVNTWVMPLAVGGMKIFGTAGSGTAPGSWVRQDGLVTYGAYEDSPFGGGLGFRMGHSSDLPNSAKDIHHYRWSYRKLGTADWTPMTIPIYRRYERNDGTNPPTFPPYMLGPKTAADLYEFRPHTVPVPPPAGVTHQWPMVPFADEVYSCRWNTLQLPPNVAGAVGTYEVKVEVFDQGGNPVSPGAGTFQFIVPESILADGITLDSRLAQASEMDGDGFVFRLVIDNRSCEAAIHDPAIGSSSANACGFLEYGSGSDQVALSFRAHHPGDRAVFAYHVVRGSSGDAIPPLVNEETGAGMIPGTPFSGDGNGNFQGQVQASTLLGGCPEAAFAQDLEVDAKATNGVRRLWEYDAGALTAFALKQS